MNVRFLCPNCEYPSKINFPVDMLWQCPACDHRLEVKGEANSCPDHCVICGNTDLYKKKDFPHNLGLVILTVACIISFITYLYYQKWLTWGILIGTALFDGVLYLLVGDVIVCYRCNSHYRGIPRNAPYPFHDLGIAERYRQERIRREQIQAEKKAQGNLG